MKVGLLLPRSGAYPSIAADITVALRHCTKLQGNESFLNFVSENIGFGGSEKEVYDKAEKLLLIEEVDVLIAYIDMKVMSILEPLMFVTGKLLIVLNAGANFPEKKIPQPGIIYLTQQHSFLSSLTGKAAGKGKGIYATTFYDCGYMHGAAMNNAFEKNGGAVIFNYINKDKFDESFTVKELTDFLNGLPEKKVNILCIMDEQPAALFYNRLNTYEHADKLSLFVSPRMLTTNAIGAGGFGFYVTGHADWLPQAESKQNIEFTGLYKTTPKKEPSIFSLAGWEAGLILNELRACSPEMIRSAEEAVTWLKQKPLHSPRGILTIDPGTNFYITKTVYKCDLPPGEIKLRVSPDKPGEEEWNDFVKSQNDLPASGWTNTYLCY